MQFYFKMTNLNAPPKDGANGNRGSRGSQVSSHNNSVSSLGSDNSSDAGEYLERGAQSVVGELPLGKFSYNDPLPGAGRPSSNMDRPSTSSARRKTLLGKAFGRLGDVLQSTAHGDSHPTEMAMLLESTGVFQQAKAAAAHCDEEMEEFVEKNHKIFKLPRNRKYSFSSPKF